MAFMSNANTPYLSTYLPAYNPQVFNAMLPDSLSVSALLDGLNAPTAALNIPKFSVATPPSNLNLNLTGLGDQLSLPTTPVNPLGNTPIVGEDVTPFSTKLGLGIGAVNSIISAINGHRSYQLGKSQLTAQTDQFNKQFAAQRGLVNSQLADRQDWRNRNQPGKFMSTAEYMDKYGVK